MVKEEQNRQQKGKGIDWGITLLPLLIVICISLVLMVQPKMAGAFIEKARELFVNKFGFFYILLGLGFLFTTIGLAFSKYGKTQLGNLEKPRYSNFSWGAMIFTSTMAADILYWSLIEWSYYYTSSPFARENMSAAMKQDMASAYPLFHWGPIPWTFYLLPAAAYAYMMFIRKRNRQTLSEACRPVLGKQTDGFVGKLIDIFAVVGLLAGMATAFSLSTPLLSAGIARLFGIEETPFLSVGILLVIGVVFISAVLFGMGAISYLAKACVVIFSVLIGIFFVFGPKIYLIETGITAIGTMLQNFFAMATWMDPLRLSASGGSGNGFPQNWTIFYWAYWISCFVATPFFIARISEGRTIKNTILGGMSCGLLGTFTSFITFGGYGLFQQTTGNIDIAGALEAGMKPADVILSIFDQLPITNVAIVVLILAMIAFYASTFDAVSLVLAGYSERDPEMAKAPRKSLQVFWALVFLLLPIALLFSESTLSMLQTISIMAALPLGIIMIVIIRSFFKDMKEDYDTKK